VVRTRPPGSFAASSTAPAAGAVQVDGRHEAGNAGADNDNRRLGHGHGEINAAAPVGAPDAGSSSGGAGREDRDA
jgi:hypothetical protein